MEQWSRFDGADMWSHLSELHWFTEGVEVTEGVVEKKLGSADTEGGEESKERTEGPLEEGTEKLGGVEEKIGSENGKQEEKINGENGNEGEEITSENRTAGEGTARIQDGNCSGQSGSKENGA